MAAREDVLIITAVGVAKTSFFFNTGGKYAILLLLLLRIP